MYLLVVCSLDTSKNYNHLVCLEDKEPEEMKSPRKQNRVREEWIFFCFFFGPRQVLVAAHGVFIEARGLLHSCGTQAPEGVGSVVCGTRALSLRCASSVVVACGLSCLAACGILVP